MIIARHRLSLDIPATAFLWMIFAVIVAAVGVAMAGLGAITGSVWEPAARVPRWFAAAVGASFSWSSLPVYLAHGYTRRESSLPVYLAHGYTRREFAMQMPVFIAGFAATLAVLMTIGFAVETIVFRAAGLPSTLIPANVAARQGGLCDVWVVSTRVDIWAFVETTQPLPWQGGRTTSGWSPQRRGLRSRSRRCAGYGHGRDGAQATVTVATVRSQRAAVAGRHGGGCTKAHTRTHLHPRGHSGCTGAR